MGILSEINWREEKARLFSSEQAYWDINRNNILSPQIPVTVEEVIYTRLNEFQEKCPGVPVGFLAKTLFYDRGKDIKRQREYLSKIHNQISPSYSFDIISVLDFPNSFFDLEQVKIPRKNTMLFLLINIMCHPAVTDVIMIKGCENSFAENILHNAAKEMKLKIHCEELPGGLFPPIQPTPGPDLKL